MAPHADRAHTQPLVEVFERLIVQSPWLARVPGVVEWLRDSPRADVPVETFFYWSRETYGAGRPVVGVWHVGMFRPGTDESLPPFVVVSKQIAATHYVDGAIGLTLVTHPDETGTRYLVYVNRSQIDVVGGFFGGIARRIVESRVRRETPVILQGLRTRIESGDPPMPGGHRLHE